MCEIQVIQQFLGRNQKVVIFFLYVMVRHDSIYATNTVLYAMTFMENFKGAKSSICTPNPCAQL